MPTDPRDLIVLARDGFPLSARLFPADAPRAAVMISAGTGFPKGFYERFARHAQARGLTAVTYDFRGIAGSRPDDLAALEMDYPDWGRLDMPAVLDALAEAAPGVPLVHVGHSVGGHFVGFMDNAERIARHAFVSVGSGFWGRHHLKSIPLELFFWFGFGPADLRRRGYVKGGGLWAGTDLPRGVFETWRRWCLNPRYFEDELNERLQPHRFEAVTGPIRSWTFTDDPIATPETARRLMRVYPTADWDLVVARPSELGVSRVGHEGAFRRGMEPLWDRIVDWLVEPPAPGPT